MLFAKQKELANLKRDEVEDVFREEDEKEQKSTGKQPVPEESLIRNRRKDLFQ